MGRGKKKLEEVAKTPEAVETKHEAEEKNIKREEKIQTKLIK